MSWECQGRQQHGWFGSGTCGDSGAAALDRGGAKPLTALLAGWARAPEANAAAFRAAHLPETTSDLVAGLLRTAALGVGGAATPGERRAASGALAEAVQAVGPDRWAKFVTAALDRVASTTPDGTTEAQDPRRQAGKPLESLKSAGILPTWKECHDKCVDLYVGRGYGSQAPLLYRRCVRECLGAAGDSY